MTGDAHHHDLCGLELPCDREACTPEAAQKQMEELKLQLRDIAAVCEPREQKILEMRFGLVDNVLHTLEEVGEELGVTREHIRQIEAKAIESIRKVLDVDR